MLTAVDGKLFSNDCEVVHVPSHNLRIYLIQKNASSSLRLEAERQNWSILRNDELLSLSSIDVFLRDPRSRIVSGINTFVQHLIRDQPWLDAATCEFFATQYLFLNRHYLPQWHWLLNLARYINTGCRLRLHSMDGLSKVTSRCSRAGIRPPAIDQTSALLLTNSKLELWFLLDRILLGRCGQSLTWQEIMQIYQEHPAQPLQIVLDRMESVRRVLC